jgi:tetratricopeptide (TPR) repeat protein
MKSVTAKLVMRLALVSLVVATFAATAAADPAVPVFGPARTPGVDKTADAACVADVACLAKQGGELAVKQVAGVTVTRGRAGKLTIRLVLVDVAAAELIGNRNVVTTARKLKKDLPAAIKKLVDEVPIERAKALFAEGNQHYNLGEFAPALEAYKAAYRIAPYAAFLFNIAQCHRKLGQHKEAIAMYQSYLVGLPTAPNKEMVTSLIDESKAALAEEQRVADQRAAEQARLESERIAAEKKKVEDERKAREAEALAAVEQRKAEEARIKAEREREQERERTYNRHPARKWAYVAGGVGVASLVAGGVFGMGARNAQSAFDDAGCGDPGRILPADALGQCRDDRDRGKRDALYSNVFLASGGALVLGSALLFLIDPGNIERPDRGAHVAISPTSVQLMVHF